MSATAPKPSLGFIGVGRMGHGMARNLLAAGYPLSLIGHRNRAPVDDLVGRGARELGSAGELAAAVDILLLCVTSSAVVEALMAGPDGILARGRRGLIVIDTSTGDPAVTLRLGEQLAARGMQLVDAPVTRTPREAEEGRLNSMLGGAPEVLERVRPVIGAYSENVFEIGPLGSALKLKLINNLLALTHAAIAAEAVAAARTTGVDPQKLYEVVSQGGANSAMLQMLVPRLLAGDESGLQFNLRGARKDLGCYRRMVADTGLPSLLGDTSYQLYNLANALGHGDAFVAHLAQVLEDLAATGRPA